MTAMDPKNVITKTDVKEVKRYPDRNGKTTVTYSRLGKKNRCT